MSEQSKKSEKIFIEDVDNADTIISHLEGLIPLADRLCDGIGNEELSTSQNAKIFELRALLDAMLILVKDARKPIQKFCS